MAAFFPSPFSGFLFSSPSSSSSSSSSTKVLHFSSRLFSASSSVGLSHLLKAPREHLCLLVCSSFQDIHHSHYLSRLPGNLKENLLERYSTLGSVVEACLSIQASWLNFFDADDSRKSANNHSHETAPKYPSNGRVWTNLLLAVNVFVYVAQVATQGKLLQWGAKVNSLIGKGQIWRLATSCFLHADIFHLVINCYSLNSIGPTLEKICGHKRFLAIYFGSAITSSATSYRFCQFPAVGASGALFGLVASYAIFLVRHRGFIRGGEQDLAGILKVIAINMAIGLLFKSIDNWGHIGGLLGGAAISWFVGPLWRSEIHPGGGKPIISDKAPIFHFIEKKRSN